MKKTQTLLVIAACAALVGCTKQPSSDNGYVIKDVNVYREADQADKTLPLRFYDKTPNVPYINFTKYYEEFFHSTYRFELNDGLYTYKSFYKGYMKFDAERDLFFAQDFGDFSVDPNWVSESSKTFIKEIDSKTTPASERVINLKNYNIDIHSDSDGIYVPVTFLSDVSGGNILYNVAYNGKDIYVIDYYGMALGNKRDTSFYKSTYYDVLGDFETERPADLAEYTYNELRLVFDNYRGYTSQLLFGDSNLMCLGLDGLLEQYYPSIKEGLLSANKETYLKSYLALFFGLYDGGHTSPLLTDDPADPDNESGFFTPYLAKILMDENVSKLGMDFMMLLMKGGMETTVLSGGKNGAFSLTDEEKVNGFYYRYDDPSKTAYIGFDTFTTDYSAWDKFYKDKAAEDQAPVATDTYAFVRSKLYQALGDGAKNLVLDLSTNGGGDTSALEGIYGLFNDGEAYYSTNDTFNRYRSTRAALIDINLDGECDELDKAEAAKFQFNVGVLTSANSFSCGNLLPSIMKESGFKIIGEKSGGGSCSVFLGTTADGVPFSRSSYHCITNASGDNIDDGVPVDLDIMEDKNGRLSEVVEYFYDPAYTGEYLSTAYNPLP